MTFGDFIILSAIIIGIIVVGLFYLNRWASKKMATQESFIERSRQRASIFIIDKDIMKAKDSNLPKAAIDQMPKYAKIRKIPLVKAKIGNQIVTLMCDKRVYNVLTPKKTVKVELAGIYILSVEGMKSKEEMKKIKKEKNKNKSLLQKMKVKK